MTDKPEAKRRITLGQLTLELQQREAQQIDIKAIEASSSLPNGGLEDAIARHVALGLAKRRAHQ